MLLGLQNSLHNKFLNKNKSLDFPLGDLLKTNFQNRRDSLIRIASLLIKGLDCGIKVFYAMLPNTSLDTFTLSFIDLYC